MIRVYIQVNSVAEALLVRESQIRESLQTEEGLVEKEIKSGNPLWAGNMRQKTKDAFLESPMFILLDFRYRFGKKVKIILHTERSCNIVSDNVVNLNVLLFKDLVKDTL